MLEWRISLFYWLGMGRRPEGTYVGEKPEKQFTSHKKNEARRPEWENENYRGCIRQIWKFCFASRTIDPWVFLGSIFDNVARNSGTIASVTPSKKFFSGHHSHKKKVGIFHESPKKKEDDPRKTLDERSFNHARNCLPIFQQRPRGQFINQRYHGWQSPNR